MDTSKILGAKDILISYRGVFAFYFFLMVSIQLNGQNHTYYGYIEDKETGERIIAANLVDTSSNTGTISNSSGFFSFSSPKENPVVQVSCIGYQPIVITLGGAQKSFVIRLSPTLWLEEVLVKESQHKAIEEELIGTNLIPIQQIQSAPSILGEKDVLKVLQLLPGVQGGNEGQSGLFVRGGTPDQNLVILDDIPLYNISHLFGFFSALNADAIKHIEVLKGGFPARYAGRLSSIVDIYLKDGNLREWSGSASLGLLASRFSIDGPLKKGKTAMIFSGRRTFLDIFGKSVLKDVFGSNAERSEVSYFFHDINFKLSHILNDRSKIVFGFHNGQDQYSRFDALALENQSLKYETGLGWRNYSSSLKWEHEWHSKLYGKGMLIFTDYSYRTINNSFVDGLANGSSEDIYLNYQAGIQDFLIKYDVHNIPSNKHFIRFGLASTFHRYRPGKFKNSDLQSDVPSLFEYEDVNATELGLYIEDDMTLSTKLKMNVGTHYSLFSVGGHTYQSLQPRIALNYLINKLALKLSVTKMVQYPHLLTNDGVGLPTDLWVPTTNSIEPEVGWQYSLGLAKSTKGIDVSLEGYYRNMKNQLNFKPGSGLLGNIDWQDKVIQGEGYAYGLEIFAHRKIGKLSGWLAYTLSWSNRKFQDLNDGLVFPYRYDRRHNLSLFSSLRLSSRFSLSTNWIFYTGSPITIASISTDKRLFYSSDDLDSGTAIDAGATYLGGLNNYRLGNYHRLDMELTYKWGKEASHEISVGGYNIYNRRNPYYFTTFSESYRDSNGQSRSVARIRQVSLFPFIPSFTYKFTF